MLAASELQDIAAQVTSAQRDRRLIEPFTTRIPAFDLPSAYAVAHLLHERHRSEGALPVGRKIGFTNARMWGIYGVREPIWAYMIAALESFSISLSCNGERREVGRGADVLGSPLHALAHLTQVLATQPDSLPLQANEIVTTGTITTAHTLNPGESWQTELQGIALPGLAVSFEY